SLSLFPGGEKGGDERELIISEMSGGGEGAAAAERQELQLPPGFRFHPTDEELVVQYLRRKAFGLPLPAAVIPDLHNLFKLDPWDIPGASSDGDKYFFAVR
ncbi:NAC family transcription factor, partial [Shewanella sp. A3A]|nr:NAC family transcription factor [Shewanella ferrihydritica]